MDQDANVVVLGNEDASLSGGLGQQSGIARIGRTFTRRKHIMTGCPHIANRLGDDIGVGEDAHPIRRGW